MKVTNLISPHNRKPVANQYRIDTEEGIYFQSYKDIVAFKAFNGGIKLDPDQWDRSPTTLKYLCIFLDEDEKGIRRKAGDEYEFVELNK